MYEIKKLFKGHIEENFIKYILAMTVLVIGVFSGFVFSNNISVSLSENLKQEVGTVIEEFSEGKVNKNEIFKNSLMKNTRIVFLIFIGGFSLWLIPVSILSIMSYGFSLGFTTGYLSLNFGGEGMSIALASILTPLVINIPVFIILTVVAFNNNNRKRSRGDGCTVTYALIFVFMFLLTSVSFVSDTFIIPWIIRLICM